MAGTGPGPVLLYVLIVVLVLAAIGASIVLTRRPGAPPDERDHAPPAEVPPAPASPAPAPMVAPTEPPIAAPPAEAPAPAEAPSGEAPPIAHPPLRERLSRARSSFGQALVRVFGKGVLEAADWEEVEAVLLQADVGIVATSRIVGDLKAKALDVGPG